ncbi:MAG: VOC family protein [Bacteroidota bacterium]
MYQIKTIIETIYSLGEVEKVKHFFCDYGGWSVVGKYQSNQSVLDFWNVPNASAEELLIQFDDHPTGLLRLVKYHNIEQEYARSSQKPWDTGGIMDINLRVHSVEEAFNDLREMGWHGLSDPLLQVMGPFKLYDTLMQGYDDVIIGLTHRVEPKLELKEGFKLPTHVYNSSLTVKNLKKSRAFYEQLGFSLLNEYEVKKETPQENMFGIPFNIIPDVNCKANIFSPDGTRDVVFQIVEFDGVSGKDFSAKVIPPNRGFLMHRVEVEGIEAYYRELQAKEIAIDQPLQKLNIEPYGECQAFSVIDPDGVWWTFLERPKEEVG